IELKNFKKTLNTAIKHVKDAKDDERLEKLHSFKKDKFLELRVSYSYDLFRIKSIRYDEKIGFFLEVEEIEKKLGDINVAGLEYDHPLCSGILDNSLKLLKKMSEKSRQTFKIPSEKFKLPENFVKNKKCLKSPQVYKDASFDEFLDEPEKLHELTNQMLKVLSQVWSSPKWKVCIASAERKESGKQAKRPDYMVIAQVSAKEVEIRYLEMGRPKSSSKKQKQDYKKLNRFGKDLINEV
ncbi:5885_t:CDS:2, partial [Racocetra fulgida]